MEEFSFECDGYKVTVYRKYVFDHVDPSEVNDDHIAIVQRDGCLEIVTGHQLRSGASLSSIPGLDLGIPLGRCVVFPGFGEAAQWYIGRRMEDIASVQRHHDLCLVEDLFPGYMYIWRDEDDGIASNKGAIVLCTGKDFTILHKSPLGKIQANDHARRIRFDLGDKIVIKKLDLFPRAF